MSLSRYLAPAVLAASLGLAAIAAPAPAQAQSQSDDLVRVLVNVADVAMRGNQPYYRYGDYGYNDRLIGQRDRYGRIVYYRTIPRAQYRNGPPYGNAYGYYNSRRGHGPQKVVTCYRNGECTTTYFDARHDRDGRNGYNNRDGRYGYNDHDGRDGYNDRDGRDGYNDRDGRYGYNDRDGRDGYNDHDRHHRDEGGHERH